MPIPVVDLKALIVSPDPRTTATFTQVFRDLKVAAEGCTDQASASQHLAQAKFEAVIVDLHESSV